MRKAKNSKVVLPSEICPEVRDMLQSFKTRLTQMMQHKDETSAFDAETIRIILYELSPADSNLILAYYGVFDCSPTALAKLVGTNTSYIIRKIKNIQNKISELNDTPKTTYNLPRECVDY